MMLGARTGAWAKSGGPMPQEYGGLKFTAEAANSSVQMTTVGTPPAVTLIKSFDGVNWSAYTVGDVISLSSVGDFVYLAAGAGGNEAISNGINQRNWFKMSGRIAASGDITSLVDFSLHRSDVKTGGYAGLFYGCKSLTSAPMLTAVTLDSNCYASMFYGCSSLTEIEIMAEVLRIFCMMSMFTNCSSLSSIKVHFTTAWSNYTLNWVANVSSKGIFYKPKSLPGTRGVNAIPVNWTVVNID